MNGAQDSLEKKSGHDFEIEATRQETAEKLSNPLLFRATFWDKYWHCLDARASPF